MTNKRKDAIRGVIAGGGAVACKEAAEVLFEAGGKALLSGATRQAIRESAESLAGTASVQLTGTALKEVAKELSQEGAKQAVSKAGASVVVQATEEAAKEVAAQTAKSAARAIAGQAGRAAGLGAVIDGAIGAWEAAVKYDRGEIDGTQAVVHVAKEAGTGAAASAAGVLAGAALVALTGPVSLPVLFGVGAVTSVAAKLGLMKLVA